MEKIIFQDPETEEKVEFCCLEQTQLNGIHYLLVALDEEGDSEAYILKEIASENEESTYEMVDDDAELNAIGKIFAELLEDVDFLYED